MNEIPESKTQAVKDGIPEGPILDTCSQYTIVPDKNTVSVSCQPEKQAREVGTTAREIFGGSLSPPNLML